MRLLLTILLSALMLAGCQGLGSPGYQIDEQATAQAPWKAGEVIAEGTSFYRPFSIYRKFTGVTDKGYFVVQDFYTDNDKKFTDPMVIMDQKWVDNITLPTCLSDISNVCDGVMVIWYSNGQKQFEGNTREGTPQGHFTQWYENGQKAHEGHYQDGEQQGLWTQWDESGRKTREIRYEAGQVVSDTRF